MARISALPLLLLVGCLAEFPDPPTFEPDPPEPADAAVVDAEPPPTPDAEPPCGMPEICNGLDDDCDGEVDESVPLRACPLQLGVCRGSRQVCEAGAYQPCTYDDLDQNYVLEEGPGACGDRVDNDCDGAVDEGCMCEPGDIQPCGTNEGECSSGNQVCEGGVFGRCVGAREPVIEQLNGVDDDCDGQTDEGPPPAEITLDLADLAVGGLGERPGLPGQVARAAGLPVQAPGRLVLRPAPLVDAVFIPTPGPCPVAEEVSYDFEQRVLGGISPGVHGKGPAGLVPHPADVLGLEEYRDPGQHSFLEMPTNYGISFDLAAVTRRFGRPARRLVVRLGTLGPGRVTFLILVDGVRVVGQTVMGAREPGPPLEVNLGPLARTLTLVTTDAGEPGSRPAYFGDAVLHFR